MIMKKWLQDLKYCLQRIMQGRYGFDELSQFISILGLILLMLSFFLRLYALYLIAFALLVWTWFRALSKNIYKRQAERSKYLNVKSKTMQKGRLCKNKWRDRKTHKYYKCPHCKAVVRITKPGKGRKISIHCPKCGNSFEKKT